MVAFREATSEEALFAVEIAMRSSVAPPLMCEFLAVMMPALDGDERTSTQ